MALQKNSVNWIEFNFADAFAIKAVMCGFKEGLSKLSHPELLEPFQSSYNRGFRVWDGNRNPTKEECKQFKWR